MRTCGCSLQHERRRVVLTGGPGAGKTAVLELIRQHFCEHVLVLPEAASIVFGGGFPRKQAQGAKEAAQRAIFFVQRELEAVADANGNAAIIVCDRGTLDGLAYWPSDEGVLWTSVGSSRERELARYDEVLHLRVPEPSTYNHANPLRVETPHEAAELDHRIEHAWRGHPHRHFVPSDPVFLKKAFAAIEHLRLVVPECCRKGQGTLAILNGSSS